MQPSFFVWASLSLGWFSNRMGKSVDGGTCKLKNRLDQLQGNKLGSGSHIQSFPCTFSWSTDVPILLLNQPNILFQVAAKLTWLEVLRAVFTGTVNKTKWPSPRVLCFGSLFRNYPPYCKTIYMAVLIISCLFLIYCQTSNRADLMVRTTPCQYWGPQYTGTASVRAWTQEWKDLSSPGLPQATDRSSQ